MGASLTLSCTLCGSVTPETPLVATMSKKKAHGGREERRRRRGARRGLPNLPRATPRVSLTFHPPLRLLRL